MWRVMEDGESECRFVMNRIGVEHKQHDPTRKRADFRLVFHHENVWQTDSGGKADDGNEYCWCGLRRDDRLARHRLGAESIKPYVGSRPVS